MPGHVRTSANLDDIIGDGKTHVLIRAKPEKVEHKFKDKVPPDTGCCFWTMARPPKQTLWLGTVRGVEGNKIMFTDGVNVYAEGIIYDVTPSEIRFSPLKRVNYPQPKKAPTRGFTYVN